MSSSEYPKVAECDNCSGTIYVYKSQRTGNEYARDSTVYIDYNAGQKPDYHRCPNWRDTRTRKEKPPKPATRPYPPSAKQTPEVDLEPVEKMVSVDDKITTITISRTASYKYGRAKEHAEEKEEFLDSITVGLSVDVSSDDPQIIERKIDNSKQIITNELKREIWDKYQFKLIEK